MNIENLPSLPQNDDLSIQLETLKNILVSRATGKIITDNDEIEYSKLRKLLVGVPSIFSVLPKFVKTCRTLDEFWGFIKPKFSTYVERRAFLAETLNPIIERLEYESSEGSLEFKKNYEEKKLLVKEDLA